MAMITDEVKNLFKSERLCYTQIDESDENYKAFDFDLENDPEVQALSSPLVLRPRGKKKDVESQIGYISKAFLGVAICLLPADEPILAGIDASATTESSTSINEQKSSKPTIIGNLVLNRIPGMEHNRSITLGISIATAYQGKGYGSEAINWALDWVFRHVGVHTVALETPSYNTRAAHVYEKLGFVLEGRRREQVWFNRQFHDLLLYSITEGEWEVLRGLKKP